MKDEKGIDERIIAVPVTRLTKRYVHVAEYTNLPEITIEQTQLSFEHYKDLEPGKWVNRVGWGSRAEALVMIRQSIERAR